MRWLLVLPLVACVTGGTQTTRWPNHRKERDAETDALIRSNAELVSRIDELTKLQAKVEELDARIRDLSKRLSAFPALNQQP